MRFTHRPRSLTIACALAGTLLIGATVSADPVEYEGHLYDLIDTDMNWSDSADDAASYSASGIVCHLVTITSSGEAEFLYDEFGSFNGVWPWIGLSQQDGTEPAGGWEWITGESVGFTDWESGEPNDSEGGEDCAEISDAGWNDTDCSNDRPYLLECEPAVPATPRSALWALAVLLILSGLSLIRRFRRI